MSSPRLSVRKLKKQGIPLRKHQITSRSKSPKSKSPKRSPSCKRNSRTLKRSCGTDFCKTGKNHYYEQNEDGKRERISEEELDDVAMVKNCSREKLTSTSGPYFLKEFTDKTTSILYDRINYECPQAGTIGTLVQQDKNTHLFVYQNEEGDDIALYVIQHRPGLISLGLDKKLEVWPLNRNWRRGYIVKSKGYCTPERLFINQINPKESLFQYNNTILVSKAESKKYPYIINDNSQQYGHIYYILNTAVTAILNYGQPPELLSDTYEYLSNFSKLFDRYIFIRMILAILDSKRNFINDRFIIREYLAEQGFIDRTDLTLLNIEKQMNEDILLGNVQFTPEISSECPRAGTAGKVMKIGHGWIFAYKTKSNNIKGLFVKQNEDKKLEVFGKNIAYNQAFYISKLVGYQKERIVCELFIKFIDDEQENAVLVYDNKAIPYPDIAYAEPVEGWFTWFNTVILLGMILAGVIAFYISKDPSKLYKAYNYMLGIKPGYLDYAKDALEAGKPIAAESWNITKNIASGFKNYIYNPLVTGFAPSETPSSGYIDLGSLELNNALNKYYNNTRSITNSFFDPSPEEMTTSELKYITGFITLVKDSIGTLMTKGVIQYDEGLPLLKSIIGFFSKPEVLGTIASGAGVYSTAAGASAWLSLPEALGAAGAASGFA